MKQTHAPTPESHVIGVFLSSALAGVIFLLTTAQVYAGDPLWVLRAAIVVTGTAAAICICSRVLPGTTYWLSLKSIPYGIALAVMTAIGMAVNSGTYAIEWTAMIPPASAFAILERMITLGCTVAFGERVQ